MVSFATCVSFYNPFSPTMGNAVSAVIDAALPVLPSAITAITLGLLGKRPKRPVDFTPIIQKQPPTTTTEEHPKMPEKHPTPLVPVPESKSVEQLISAARKKFGLDVTNDFNFAIVGQSGTGKSSLINALRGMEDDEEGAAPIGETETTMEMKKYTHPKLPYVALWDVPGAGTLKQPAETYFENHMLYAFDCILVLSGDRFFEIDFGIARKAREFKRPCAFVRTKADLAVKSISKRKKTTMLEASRDLRKMVNESFRECLKKSGLSEENFSYKLYIVSAWALTDEFAYANRNDKTLVKMDELELLRFVENSVRYRV